MKRAGAKVFLLFGLTIWSVPISRAQKTDEVPWWWAYPFKAFSQPSESMIPTIRPVSTFLVYKKPASELRRGDLIAFRKDEMVWVMRVVGLPGDRIAMIDGLVSLNDRLATYGEAEVYTGPLGYFGRPLATARQRTELLAGEETPHLILDQGSGPYDNTVPVTVAPGHIYVLGDNRDNASDSRIPADRFGAGQIAFADIYGVLDLKSIQWKPQPARPAAPSSGRTTVIVPSTEREP